MKLDEFTRTAPFTSQEKSAFLDKIQAKTEVQLEKLGWKYEDAGVYSDVFVNPSKDYILKINTRRDLGFLWFMFLAHKYPNPHFPRIMDVAVAAKDNEGEKLYIYKLERLEQVPKSMNPLLTTMDWCLVAIRNGEAEDVRDYIENIPDKYRSNPSTIHIGAVGQLSKYLEESPELEKALNIIGKNAKNFIIDTGAFNFMQRKDGTLVINDPYAD